MKNKRSILLAVLLLQIACLIHFFADSLFKNFDEKIIYFIVGFSLGIGLVLIFKNVFKRE